ncbi:glycosyltransferase family 39 protein [Roseospira marina]|uniref:Glycosyltransferase family 39 protein n=1 Tax=Roseospira marina TaxID=140057 RepID=A0A5M6IC29_9PROT|nr:glycosyltransferase family 39 protein [Roseospira marina]KAA5605806.1 glycosyltransferase family 39 protein [Roseospira marina]MBB4313622.1 hypothetical protein [Roseospira marina]MBB5086784.1 hypothetical protein [Roseospira marina]
MSDRSLSARSSVFAPMGAVLCGPWGVALLVFLVTAGRLALLSSPLAPPVTPGEADLWVQGRAGAALWPETGPLLPWLLSLLSDTCGADAPCLRLVGPVTHGAAMWFLYRLGTRLFDAPTGFWCAVLYATMPLVLAGGLVVGPMALLMPVWTVALLALARTHVARSRFDWVVLGACVALGLVIHPVMSLFVPLAVLYLAMSPEHAGLWRRPGPYVALLIGLAGLLPALMRAASDQWAGVYQLVEAITAPVADPAALWPTVALGIVLGGPVVAGVLAVLLLRTPLLMRDGAWADYRVRLLMIFSVPVLAATLWLTLLLKDDVMLTAPAVPAAVAMVCGWLLVQGRGAWLVLAAGINMALCAALLTGPDTARRFGWVPPAVLDPEVGGRGFEAAGSWLRTLAEAYPDAPLAVAGEDAPLLAYHAAVRGLSPRVLGTGPREDRGAFQGLLVMPAALAEAGETGATIRARLTVTLPDGRVRAWAAAMVP